MTASADMRDAAGADGPHMKRLNARNEGTHDMVFDKDGTPAVYQPTKADLARSMIWRYEHGLYQWRQDRVDAWRERLAFHEANERKTDETHVQLNARND